MPRQLPDPCEIIPKCPICLSGPLTVARRMKDMDLCLCERCGTSLSVPHDAWELRRRAEQAST